MKKIILFLLTMFLFEPNLFVKLNLINSIYIIGAIICFFYCIITYINNKIKISKMFWLLLLYRLVLFFPTISINGDLLKWGYLTIIILSICMIIEIINRYDPKYTIDVLYKIFLILCIINAVTYFIFPDGLVDTGSSLRIFFLGIRTRFSDYAFPLIILSILAYNINKISKKELIISIFIGLINIIMAEISTAIIGAFIFFLLYILYNRFKLKISKNFLVFIILVLTLGIVFFRVQVYFQDIIFQIFSKDATLTGRTEIWDLAFERIKDKIWFGYGIINDGNFVLFNGQLWQSHNQILQLVYDGGIVTLIIFLKICITSLSSLKNVYEDKIKITFMCGLLAFFIMMISEIFSYYPTIYVILYLSYKVNDYIEKS